VVIFLIWVSNITLRSFVIGILFIIIGIIIRVFSGAGIYPHLRKNKFIGNIFLIKNLFSIMRHPLYIGNFLIITGLTVSVNWRIYIILPIIFILFWTIYGFFIYKEELLLKEYFGEEYIEYKRNVPFLPLFPMRLKKDKIPIKIGKEWNTIGINLSILILFLLKDLICTRIF